MVSCAWLIFIRAESSRLPEKCYKLIGGRTMLDHITTELESRGVLKKDIFLCTTTRSADNEISLQAQGLNIRLIRGNPDFPVRRYFDNRHLFSSYDMISRVNGDSPLYNAGVTLKAIEECKRIDMNIDAVSNIIERQFPSGLSIEIYSRRVLDRVLEEVPRLCDVEHMAEIVGFMLEGGKSILEIRPKSSIDTLFRSKFTVDTRSDLDRIRRLFDAGEAEKVRAYFADLPITVGPPER